MPGFSGNCLAVSTDGTRFVCSGSAVYTFSSSGVPTLLAGHTMETGLRDGQGSAARFFFPQGIAVDGAGNVLVADTWNHALRKVTRNGTVSTLAGNGKKGYAGGVGNVALFSQPWGIVVAEDGTIYVNDSSNNCVRKVEAVDGVVSTLAGDRNCETSKGFADGLGSTARFSRPTGLALDKAGHLIVTDSSNDCIRRVTTPEGRVTTVAGSPENGRGFADGNGAAARFSFPVGIAVDGNNNIFVADSSNNRIRMIAGATSRVTTVAGNAEEGKVDGPGASARFYQPKAMAMDERGRLLVNDSNRHCVRVVEASLEPPRQLLAARLLFLQVGARSPRTFVCLPSLSGTHLFCLP